MKNSAKKYLLLQLYLLLVLPLMGQNPPVTLPADGNWPTIVGDSIMLIGPKQEALTEEQRYFNPPYLLVYPGKEHLKNDMIRAALCDCDPTKPNRRIGVFSVAPDKQVSFSQGNLQYLPAANIWKFANTQYEYLGNANKYLKPTFRNWVDLFGWSANNTTAPFGVSTSTNAADYAGDFVDWGTNTICGDKPGTWRTLSADEWEYLLHGRENAQQLRTKGSVEGKEGVILLPDSWICPEGYTIAIIPDEANLQPNVNTYSQADWSKLEDAGAIILPSAGMRRNAIELEVRYPNIFGGYWTCTNKDEHNSYCYTFHTQDCEYLDYSNHIYGRSVRLVHDTIVPETIPEPCLIVKVNDTLSINMMCVEGGTFTMGNGENAHPVSLSSYSIGQTEVTQALWEAVMGTNPSANTASKQLPVTNVSWRDCQEFIKKLNQQTGMRFRLPTEAEWEYAARGGQKSKGYTYAGSNDIKEVAWYNGNSGNTPHAVAQKKPNELGIYDMSGNVWEWCHDWHAPYPTTHQYNPLGPEVGQMVGTRYLRVFRGGSYGYAAAYHQNEFRDITGPEPDKGTANLGLRLVLSDEVKFQTIHVNDTLSFHMMDVKGGTFMMGAMEGDTQANANEKPAHEVTLTYDYYIGQTEVTQALWKAVMGYNPSTMIGDNLPVNNVLWEDADAFTKRLSLLTGRSFHLPTEAEWEFAARGGNKSQGYLYAGSNNIQKVAWYGSNSGNTTQPVGTKQPNELGIYDMSGNVIEWCSDWLGPYSAEAQVNPIGPATGAYHVYCGGCWYLPANVCRCTHRRQTTAGYREAAVGLRVALREKVEPEAVDLGLSIKWANFNIGAFDPTHYGDYFAWGETEPKETYSWATYKWCQGTANTFTKYCSNSQYGNADYKTTLDPEDDAAIVHLGGNWRMPTIEEWMELKQNCTWKQITINGITGCQVTAKNGNSIFLPRAGLRMSNILYAADSVGYYASSNHLSEFSHEDYASYMLMYDSSISKSSAVRYYGLPIRPVYDDIPDPCLVVKVNDTLSINMMCVEGGTFMMGATDNDEKAKDDEKPAHKVTLTYDYHIMQTEVTQGLWEAVMGEDIYVAQTKMANASKPAYVGGDYPMYYVRMNDALEFIDKLNAMTGMHFRLPTEAEWEYAARGGNKSKGYLYAGSNNADDVGWYYGRGGLHRVAQLKPNELGIYDMTGNVSEMCLDYGTYGETYKAGDAVNPRGNIRSNGNRFWRGGCYTHSKDSMRVSQRSSYTPSWGGTWLGLRLVLAEDNDFRTIRVGNSYFDMSFVKGGTFMMGSDASDAEADEQPVHEVTLSDYYIGQTEVTQHLWKKVMGDENNPSAVEGNNLPVTNITWDEAQVFVQKLSEMTGMRFRLPTEAEWEYAARGGQNSKGYTYAGSDDIDQVGWYNGNSSNKTHAVGQKQPNELGIYDMTGNVWEYCSDWHMPYSAQAQTNPTGAATGEKHVLRGGCYHYDSKNCTNTNRHSYYTPDKGGASTGLRIVLEPQRYYRYSFTQEDWDAATASWGHGGRGHAPADQSCIQGTMVRGIRLKIAKAGSLDVYKVPSLLEKNEDHFELVATLTTDSTGVQDFDFAEPICIAPNEYLVFGKPSEKMPTLLPCYINKSVEELPAIAKGFAHFIGTDKAKVTTPNASLMVEFY